MDITIEAKELKKALSFLKPYIPVRSPKPVLLCVLIDANGGTARMRATTLGLHGEYSIMAGIDQAGQILVPYKELVAVCKMAGNVVHLVGDNKTAKATWPGGESEMEAYDPAEFPIFPLIGKTIGTIEAKSLSTMLSSVSFAVEKQTYRAGTMSNICLSCEGNKLEMVATDAHRLAVITGEAMLEDFSVLLPSNVGRLLGGLDGPIILAIEISEDRNNLLYLQAYGGGRRIAIQLGQGNFPIWKDVVPNDCDLPARVEMNGDELARIILSMVEGQENYEEPRVSLSLSSSGIEITSGKTSQHYTATVIGKIDIKFKSELLAEGLSFIGGLVTIAMSTPKKPVKITGNSAKHGFFKGTRQERMYILVPLEDE